MTMPSDSALEYIRESITAHFNEDIAQEALLRLCEAVLGEGQEVKNAFAYCWQVAEYQVRNDIKRARHHTEYSAEFEARGGYQATRDTRNPEEVVAAREILATLPVELIMDTPLSPTRRKDGEGLRNVDHQRRSRAVRAAREGCDM